MPWAEIVRFGLAGGVNTLLTFSAFALMVGLGIAYPLANLVAWFLGIIFSYILNLIFVFNQRRQRPSSRQFLLFASLYVVNFVISTSMLMVLVEFFGFGPLWAQCLVMPLVILLNYLASRYLVFSYRLDQI